MEVGVCPGVRLAEEPVHSRGAPVSPGSGGGTISPLPGLRLAKGFQPTRLETRTKESDACASLRVTETLRRNESEGEFGSSR